MGVLLIGESAEKSGKEHWYSRGYVSTQLHRLKQGAQPFKPSDFPRISSSLSLLSASHDDDASCTGLWWEMHFRTSCKEGEMADTCVPRRTQIAGACYFKDSRLFQDAGHEGVDPPNDSDSDWGVLFVPEGCIRAA